MSDELAARMKSYEKVETDRKLDKNLPMYMRLDGRGFSKFTKNFERPFDISMSYAMVETTKYLMMQLHADFGYTQSDEISLLFKPIESELSQMLFDGKLQKLVSIPASMATAKFNSLLSQERAEKLPVFDCRTLNLPNLSEAANMIVFRELDCMKNSISMLARTHFSHKQLQSKNGKEMTEILAGKGVYMNQYPSEFPYGVKLRRVTVERCLTQEELKKIPVDHKPIGKVIRTELEQIDSTIYNRKDKIDIIFNGAKPEND